MKKTVYPSISVIILTNDRPHLLKKALISIQKQSVKPTEVVVVDDSSKFHNETAAIIQSYTATPLRTKRNTQHSISYGRLIGMKASKGNIIVYLDDDCQATPSYVKKFREHFCTDPSLTAVVGRIVNALPENIYAATQYAYYERGLRQFYPTLRHTLALTSGRILDCEVMGIRKHMLHTMGFPQRDRMYRNDDVELGIRLIEKKERILFDPSIIAYTSPRTTLAALWTAAFWNGYSDACTSHMYHVDLRAAPYPSFFPTWWIREVISKRHFSFWNMCWYALVLLSFPTVSRIGNAWYRIKKIL